MNRRLLISLIAFSLVLGVYFLPRLPSIRNLVLDRVVSLAAKQGFQLSYQDTAGGLWSSLSLREVALQGPGLELTIDELRLRYSLISLITRELPLELYLTGTDGTLNIKDLQNLPRGGSSAIRINLRKLELNDASLDFEALPYTLPDFKLDHIAIRPNDTGYDLDTSLSTAEGSLDAQGQLALNPLRFQGEVARADARIARRWWQGIEGGTASATLSYDQTGLVLKGEVKEGAIRFFKETASNIQGTFKYQDALVTTKLTGQTLDGEATVTGQVDIPSREWSATAVGNVGLAETLDWLSQNWLPRAAGNLPVTGRSDAEVSARGWRRINLEGSSLGNGTLLGYSLEDLATQFAYTAGTGFEFEGSSLFAQGPVTASFSPQEGGFVVEALGQDLELLTASTSNASFKLERQAGDSSATGTLSSQVNRFGRELNAKVTTTLVPEGWQFQLDASDNLNESLEGSFLLSAGELQGQALAANLTVPQLAEPLNLSLQTRGPLQALTLNAQLEAPDTLALAQPDISLNSNFSGTLAATLTTFSDLENLMLNLGPLTASGQAKLRKPEASLSFSLDETPVTGDVSTVLAARDGNLSFADGKLASSAELELSDLSASVIQLEQLKGPLQVAYDQSWSALFASEQGLDASYTNGLVSTEWDNTALSILNEAVRLSGQASLNPADLESLTLDLSAVHNLGTLELNKQAELYQTNLTYDDGQIQGTLDASYNQSSERLELTGNVLDIPIEASGQATLDELDLSLTLDESLTGALTGPLLDPSLALNGPLAIAPLAERYKLPVTGTLISNVSVSKDGATGTASLEGEISQIPVSLSTTLDGWTASLEGSANVFGVDTHLGGELYPLGLSATTPYGTLYAEQTGGDIKLSGTGDVPAFSAAGWTLNEQPWTLNGSVNERSLSLETGTSSLTAQLTPSGWTLDGQVSEALVKDETSLQLNAEVSASQDNPKGKLDGNLLLSKANSVTPFTVRGNLDALDISGTLSAASASLLANLPVNLKGDLELTAALNPLERSYSASANWLVPETQPLQLSLEGQNQTFSAKANSEKLRASFQEGRLELAATDFSPNPYLLNQLPQLSLSGNFAHSPEQGWQGALTVISPDPKFTGVLNGNGETLDLSGTVSASGLSAELSGPLFPELNLAVSSTLENYASLNGTLRGPFSAPQFQGSLQTEAQRFSQPQLYLDQQNVELNANFDDGLALSLSGPTLNAQLAQNTWQGSLSVPFELEGEPHRLTGGLSGETLDPQFSGALEGSYLLGPVSLAKTGLETTLELSILPFIDDFAAVNPSDISEARATVTLTALPDLSWEAFAQAAAFYRELPLNVQVSGEGQGRNLELTGSAFVKDQELPLSLNSSPDATRISLRANTFDLAALDDLNPLPTTGNLTGSLNWNSAQLAPLGAQVEFQGELANLPLTLSATYAQKSLKAQAQLEEANLELSSKDFKSFDFTALSTREKLPANLTGKLDLGSIWQVTARGTLLQENLDLTATYDQAIAQANLQGTLGGASLSGTYLGDSIRVHLEKPPTFLGSFPLELDAALSTQTGLELNSLSAFSNYQGQTLELSAQGALYPETQVSGLLKVASYSLPLNVNKIEPGYRAQLSYNDLNLVARFSPSFAFDQAALRGQLDWQEGLSAQLESDLNWTLEDGFEGNAQVTAESQGIAATATLTGTGPLNLLGDINFQDKLRGQLTASIPKNPLNELSGQLALNGNILDFVPASLASRFEPSETAPVVTNLILSGKLNTPELKGELELSGLFDATGTLSASLQGANLQLDGDHLQGTGNLDRQGWNLELSVQQQNLASLNLVSDLKVSTQLVATQTWGEHLNLALTELELQSNNSRLSGEITLNGGWQGQLSADLSLDDLESFNLTGHIGGDIYISEDGSSDPQLSANLTFEQLGLQGNNAFLSGTGIATGSLYSPSLTLRLEGSGSARGQLLALLEPRTGRYNLSSNLELAGFQSDLDILAEKDRWQASGGLHYGNFGFVVSDETPDSLLELSGRGKLSNWQTSINLAEKRLILDGNLASLSSQTAGLFQLRADWSTSAATALSADLSNLSLFGQALADIKLELDSWASRQLRLQGDKLSARVSLSPLSWQLDNLSLPLTTTTQVFAQGSGDLNQGVLNLQLDTQLAGTNDQLSTQLSYQDRQIRLYADDSFLNGQLKLDAGSPFDGNWQGKIVLAGLELAGARLSLNGELSGAFLNPQLQASSNVALNDTQIQGVVTASRNLVHFSQNVTSPLLDGNLLITGQVGQESQLNISQEGETLSLSSVQGELRGEGELKLVAGNLIINLKSREAGFDLNLSARQNPELSLSLRLPKQLELDRLSQGITVQVNEPDAGQLLVKPGPEVLFQDFNWQTPYGALNLNGTLSRQAGWQANAEGNLKLTNSLENRLPFLAALDEQTFSLRLDGQSLTLLGQNHHSQSQLTADLRTRVLGLELHLTGDNGNLDSSLSFNPAEGPSGTLETENLAVRLPGGNLKLSLSSNISPQRLSLDGTATIGEGQLSLTGNIGLAGLLPAALAPQGVGNRTLSARLGLLDMDAIPWISERLPNLKGSLSGTANLRQNQLIAQLVSPDLRVEDNDLPLSLTLSGPLESLELTGNLARSRLTGSVSLDHAEGLFVLEQFPIQAPAEAWFGNTDVTGSLTGILRFDLPFGHLADSDIRFASEQISLTRGDITTTGDTSFSFVNRQFTLDPTTFSGIGTWQGGGVIAENELNLNFSALQADFSPLLGLIPPLSPYEPEAFGSVNVEARGSLREPIIQLSSPSFNLKLAGSQFELRNSLLQLSNQQLSYQSSLKPLSPISGELDLSGGGQLSFFPQFDANLSFRGAGNLTIPTIGQIDDFRAAVDFSPDQGWQLSSQGLLGNPFSIEGSLRPLNLQLTGTNLNLRAPQYFLVESSTDVDLNFSYEERQFMIRGGITSNQASLSGEERERKERGNRTRPRVLSLIHFDNVSLSAPRNMVFTANAGTAELGLEANLTGTAAAPELSGEARSLRGSFRFAGRNFTLQEAVASFQPSRGIYPSLDITAYSRFEKSTVTRGSTITFLEPAGPTFDVILSLTGEVVPLSSGPRSFRIDLEPQLSSEALIQVDDGVRAITENELYSLLTLGRIEANAELTGEGSLTESVTQSAIDTALDTFLLSELQKQLADALNLDVFEIRTTPLSSLITGTEDNFGVALKVGTYLSDEVFASYEISSLDNDPDILLSNEFNLRYQLAPLELGLTGRLKFLNDAQTSSIPELGINLSYAITPLIRLELGADVSNASQRFSFGVSFRW
ncbi:MAG: translocation/assembly module TamB domain-containing protein [Trueperaceae bacterium]|nr:translocation/assembly module TamB domain-containing protein [Trueperaceae bacterium]